MRARDILRSLCYLRHKIDVDRRRIRKQHCSWFCRSVELRKHIFLYVDSLEHRLDNDVAAADFVVALHRLYQGEPAFDFVWRDTPSANAGRIGVTHALKAFLQRFFRGFEHFDGNAMLCDGHCDAPAHRARPDNGYR